MKINWFSPLPPSPTGIAVYTGTILPFLTQQAEVTLWTDQKKWSADLERYATVRQFEGDRISCVEAQRADVNVYHMGNHPTFHDSIWQLSLRLPGVVVLHDLRLHDFFSCRFRNSHNREGYLQLMERWYGAPGRQAGLELWNGGRRPEEMADPYPLHQACLENAIGAIVHSTNGIESLQDEVSCPLRYLAFPYAATDEPLFTAWQARRRAPQPPYRLAIMGYLNPNRRLESFLQAWSTSRVRSLFTLDIYGPLWNENHVRAHIRACGLEDRVTMHGYTPTAELDERLLSADLAINLRFPTMGEASMSQLQVWDHALTALVTRIGWYETLPGSSVAFVDPHREIEDIQAHLESFVANPSRFAAMGRAGREILIERHAPTGYVKSLIEFLGEALAYHPTAASLYLADRVGKDLNTWRSRQATEILVDRTTAEIYACLRTIPGARQAYA